MNRQFWLFLPVGIFWLISGSAQKIPFIEVSRVNPRYLAEESGKTFIPLGPNICFARSVSDGDSLLKYYDYYFGKLAANGGNFTRIWLSVPLLELEKSTPGVYDPATGKMIDGLVGLGEKHGIRIKFCLEHFRKLTGAPAPFPSSVPFDKPVYAGAVTSMDEYFTSDKGKKLYADRMAFLAGKYRNNPVVFGWELWNEMNTVNVKDKSVLPGWTSEMLKRVKSQAPRQLVMQTLGSFDSGSQLQLYKVYSPLAGNDIAQAHRYLDKGAAMPECQAPMDQLAGNAVSSLLEFAPGKPVVLSEVGAVEPNHAGPSRLYPEDKAGVLLHDLLFAPFFAGAAAPGQSWHWDYYIEKNNLWYHFARFAEAIKGFDPVSQHAKPFQKQTNTNLRVYGLEGNSVTLLWVRNGADTWKTELEDGTPVETVSKQSIDFALRKPRKLSYYDPWKNEWKSGVPGKQIALPDFSRSIIVKLEYE